MLVDQLYNNIYVLLKRIESRLRLRDDDNTEINRLHDEVLRATLERDDWERSAREMEQAGVDARRERDAAEARLEAMRRAPTLAEADHFRKLLYRWPSGDVGTGDIWAFVRDALFSGTVQEHPVPASSPESGEEARQGCYGTPALCPRCGGSGTYLRFYDRPGGPPGNQIVRCEECQTPDLTLQLRYCGKCSAPMKVSNA